MRQRHRHGQAKVDFTRAAEPQGMRQPQRICLTHDGGARRELPLVDRVRTAKREARAVDDDRTLRGQPMQPMQRRLVERLGADFEAVGSEAATLEPGVHAELVGETDHRRDYHIACGPNDPRPRTPRRSDSVAGFIAAPRRGPRLAGDHRRERTASVWCGVAAAARRRRTARRSPGRPTRRSAGFPPAH